MFFFFFNLFIFGCARSLLLHGLFSSCGEREQLSSCSVQASLVDLRALGTLASVVVGLVAP